MIPKENLLPIHTINENLLPEIASSITEYMDLEELRKRLAECTSQLSEKQQKVLKMRYEKGMTLEAVGEALGLCGGSIEQIEKHALWKLRHPCRSNKLVEFLKN